MNKKTLRIVSLAILAVIVLYSFMVAGATTDSWVALVVYGLAGLLIAKGKSSGNIIAAILMAINVVGAFMGGIVGTFTYLQIIGIIILVTSSALERK